MKFYGYMEGGKLRCDAFAKWLAAPGRESVTIDAKDTRPKRSSDANRYYWGVCVELIHEALKEGGIELSREGTHELLRVRFLSVDRPIGKDGEFVTYVRSTTELDTKEFVEYVESCKRFAAEYLGTVIPEPNEQIELNLTSNP